jgi:cytoskeleton protein RodZ
MPGGAMVLAALILAVCAYGIWYYVSSSNQPRPERVSPVPAELAKPAAPARRAATPSAATAPLPAATAAAAPATPVPAQGSAAPTPAAPAPAAPPAATATAKPAPPMVPAAHPAAAAPPAAPAASVTPSPAAPAAAPAPAATWTSSSSPPPPPPPAPAAPPPQAAALPSVPPGSAAPAPGEGHVYGLANGDTRILIRAVKDSWIQIRDKDGKPIFTRELHPGDLYHVPNEPGLSMKTGNGSGLAVTVDGQQTPPIGGAVHDDVVLDPARLLAGTAVE